jgi:hypothetical protein
VAGYATSVLALFLVLGSFWATVSAAPHFRLYTNSLGGGLEKAGYYFPHDEFYDASMREVMAEIAKRAKPGAKVATETPGLAAYYAQRSNRADLICVSLSDLEAVKQLGQGDFVVDARGRRYFSNDAILSSLKGSNVPAFETSLAGIPSTKVYLLKVQKFAGKEGWFTPAT